MADIIQLEDDITLEPVHGRVQGHELVFDPKLYTVDLELRLAAMGEREDTFLRDGHKAEARDYVAGLLAEILEPANPGWTVDVVKQRLSVQSIGRAIGFFGLVGSGRLPRPPTQSAEVSPQPSIPAGEEPSLRKKSKATELVGGRAS